MSESVRPRLDAVALTSLAAAALAALALASHAPLTGLTPAFGADVDGLASRIASALGFAAFAALAAWFALTLAYVRRVPVAKLALRAAGWLLLIVVATAGADALGRVFGKPGTAFGAGGSLGAYAALRVADALGAAAWLPFVLASVLGFYLVADAGARFLAAQFVRLVLRGNAVVEVVAGRTWAFVAKQLAKRPKPILEEVPLTLAEPPIVTTPADPEPEPEATPDPVPVFDPRSAIRVPSLEETVEIFPAPTLFELPPLSLLLDADPAPMADHEVFLRERASLLEKTFADFNLAVKVVGIHTGPVITQYEIALETGLRLSKVTTLADDLALNLKVSAVRVVAPLPGRNTVGIEIPNEHRQTVRLKELIATTGAKAAKFKLPVFLGKDVEGRPLVYDLASMPHLLIAGRTGTGKSVCLNAIILSLLYTRQPDDCRMIMIDPKKVELSEYGKVPHLMHPVVTDDKKAEAILAWAVGKMEERYEWLRRARVRNVAAYNDLDSTELYRRIDPESEDERQQVPPRMPYIVVVIDEVGDLIMSMKKEVEGHIIRLAQKSRAAGIHLILATQKPTVDVVTGLIKSNLPARICFQVATRADSMVVLDEKGADKLLGMGDMLFLQPGTSTIIRGQGALVTDGEIERTVTHLETDEPNYEHELLSLKTKDSGSGGNVGEKLRDRDANYEQAVEVVIREQRGSTSLLQRALGIGYGRASRLIDFMAEDGIVGGFNGSNARDVLLTSEEWESRKATADAT